MRRFCFAVWMLCILGAVCSAGEAGARRYDQLPLRFANLNEYDAIALEPYRETYDRMPLHEKARVYARAFVFMNNRPPVFHPTLRERIRQSGEAANARDAYDAKKFMYRPPPDPEERREQEGERERRRRAAGGMDEAVLSGISGPWAQAAAEEQGGQDEFPPPEEFHEDDYRMESLRPGSLRLNLLDP